MIFLAQAVSSFGALVKETQYGASGQLTDYITYEYNASGLTSKMSYYDASGQLTFYYTSEYNASGLTSKMSFYDASDNLISYTTYEYNNEPTWTVTPSAGPHGSISCTPNPVNTGESSTCTVTPSVGYAVDTFTVDGNPASLTNNQYVFSNVTANHTANVTFTLKPVVTVAATDASAKEAGQTTGTYRITRTGSTTAALTVYYVMSGGAASGADYTMSSYTSATIATGATYVDVVLTALDDTLREPGERATLTLLPNGAYGIGSPASADIDIDNNNATSVDTMNATTSLDPSFGTFGRVQLDLGAGASSSANALVLLPDGKLLVAGRSTQSGQSQTGIIVRLNSDGSIDATFGSGGTVIADFGTFSEIYGLARQDDGNIVAIGSNGPFAASMNVMRLTAEGVPDTSFAGDGTAEVSDASATKPDAVAIQTDGGIVVAANRGSNNDGLTVFRLLADGTLDTNFGTNGFASAPVTGTDRAQSITLQADGRIVVVGTTNANTNPFLNPNVRDFAVARFNSNGSLDATFDSDGMKVIDIASRDDDAQAVLIQPDGKIVIAGSAYMTSSRTDCALVRLNSDGSLDAGFDGDGKTMFYMGGLSICESLTLQSDGTFIGAGTYAEALDRNFMVTRILANGQQDATFNDGAGFAIAAFPPTYRALAHDHIVQSDGKIVLAGQDEGTMNIALARFQTIESVVTHAIAATAGPHGSISCTPNPVNHGGNSTCTVTPSVGYAVDTFTVDGNPASLTNNQYAFTNVTANHTANVTFLSGAGAGTHNASGTYTWNSTTGVIILNVTNSDFICDGPDLDPDTITGVTITATTMTWVEESMTWTRSSGTAGNIVGTWISTDSATGNSYTLTFHANGTISVTGVIVQCGDDDGQNPSAKSQHWSNGYYVQLQYLDSPKTATAVSVTGPGITGSEALTYDTGHGSWNSWTLPSANVSFGTIYPTGEPFTYTFAITDATGTRTATSTVSCFQVPFADNLSPTGSVTGTPTFSWTGIGDSSAKYAVDLRDINGNNVWHKDNIYGDSIVYNGPALAPGMTYTYTVIVKKSSACSDGDSFAEGSFTYVSGGEVTTHAIAATAGPHGSISCIPSPVNHGGNSTCTVTPAAGYTVDAFTVEGSPATLTNNQYAFSNVTANYTANVTFKVTPVVTVKATDAAGTETGQTTGTYRITRTGSTTADLIVHYAMGGTAASGDYTMQNYASAIIPAGKKYVDVKLTPNDDAVYEIKETAILALSPDSAYGIGKTAIATVNITDNEPVVTVKASPATAKEAGPVAGKYRIARKGNKTLPLAVYYAMSGTATGGADYNVLPGAASATIPAGSVFVDVILTPVDDAVYDPAEKAILTLSADSAYGIGKPAAATITITDDEPVVTVKASPATAKEAGPTAGKYRIARKGNKTLPLTVYYNMSGTATGGADYNVLPSDTSATIPAGLVFVDVSLTPVDDAVYDPAEKAILTLSADSAYGIGKPAAATITITDNDPASAAKVVSKNAPENHQTENDNIRRYDFNRDGMPDILWQNQSGELQLWYMDNGIRTGQTNLEPPAVDACWKLAGVADFNADGKEDILLQYQCGTSWPLSIWHMDDYKRIDETRLAPDEDVEAGWKAVGTGDFNADGKPDILFQHQSGEQWSLSVWYMDDDRKTGASFIESDENKEISLKPTVAGVADFNADGKPDILFQHQSGEQWPLSVWYMDNDRKTGASFIESGIEPDATVQAAQGWRVGEVADFNSDGKLDILWQSQEGLLYLWRLDGRSVVTGTSLPIPPAVDPEWSIMAK